MKPVAFVIAALLLAPAALPAAPPPAKPATERYTLGLIWKGPAWSPERSAHSDSVQAAHLENNGRMYEAGKLVAAGPCGGNPLLRGVWVWRVDSLAEIPGLLAGDPAIQERRLRVDVHRWHADAGIGDDYRAAHENDPATRDSMVSFSLVLLRRGPAYTSNLAPRTRKILEAHSKPTRSTPRSCAATARSCSAGRSRGWAMRAGCSSSRPIPPPRPGSWPRIPR